MSSVPTLTVTVTQKVTKKVPKYVGVIRVYYTLKQSVTSDGKTVMTTVPVAVETEPLTKPKAALEGSRRKVVNPLKLVKRVPI